MIQKNQIKYNIKNKKDNEIMNQRRQNFKNIYTQIKRNIKTTFSKTKQKNKLNNTNSKKITENIIKKGEINNINFFHNKKPEESRNNNKAKLDKKNTEEEIYDCTNDIFLNKTEKDIKLLYNKNNSRKTMNDQIKLNIDNKIKDKEKDLFNKRSNYLSNKGKNEIKEEKKNNILNNILFHNKKMNNKELKSLNMTNKNKYYENNELKRKEDSLDKIPKLMINKKLITKEGFIKSKNIFEKINSARFDDIENHKLNLNFNKEIKSEIKAISNKNTSRISSQKLSDLKDRELNLDKIKKIKKNKIMKQITKYKKNHSMTMNDMNKILLLNDTFKDSIKKGKEKEKYSIVNLYNYPTIRNNIPHQSNFIIDSIDKENSENNIKNDLPNLNNTCFNFNEKNHNNSSLNNNSNGTLIKVKNNKTNNKNHYHNNSFNKLYNQANFYSKPVARLKKRIFDSPSDNRNDLSLNNKDINNNVYYLNKSDIQENDSLEINIKEKNKYNNTIKELLKTIKALNQIINIQKKIIEEYMLKEMDLKKEMEKKNIETKNYKNICLKLMFYLKEEKEFNILNEKNKRRNIIENQLIKENKILKELIIIPMINTKENDNQNENIGKDSDIKRNSFYKINENGSTINFNKINHQSDEIEKKEYENNTLDPLYNLEKIMNPYFNKKREKSYENRKRKSD